MQDVLCKKKELLSKFVFSKGHISQKNLAHKNFIENLHSPVRLQNNRR